MRKKPLIIAGAVLLTAAAALGGTLMLFPHLFSVGSIREAYPSIDDTMTEYPRTSQTVPADFIAVPCKGLTVKAPAEYRNPQEMSSISFKSDELTVMVLGPMEDTADFGSADDPYTAEDYAHFFEAIGENMPDTQIGTITFLRNTLCAETGRWLRDRDYEIFALMAESKESVVNVEVPYFYHGSNFDGLVCYLPGSSKNGSYVCNVLIPAAQTGQYYTVMLKAENEKLAAQVIAGLELQNDA